MEKKGFFRKKIYIFAIIFGVAFVLFYAQYLVATALRTAPVWLVYANYFYNEAVKFVFPTAVAALMIAARRLYSMKYAFARSWVLLLPMLIYTLPSYYTQYFAMTLDTLEAVAFSLINALFDLLIFYAQAVATYFLVIWLTRLHSRRTRSSDVSDIIDSHDPFNLANSLSFAFFITISVRFAVLLVLEIIETVSFLRDFSANYRIDEVIYIILSYVFLLGELLFAQWFSLYIKNKSLKTKVEETKND